jgi:hypothetical protein
LNDNLKSLPEWLEYEKDNSTENFIKNFYKDNKNVEKYLPELIEYDYKQVSRMSHMESFKIDICNWLSTGKLESKDMLILFNYHGKSYISGHSSYHTIK